MKAKYPVALAVILFLSTALQADRCAPAKRMRDPGIENTRYWSVLKHEDGKMTAVTGQDNVHSGDRAARIEVLANAKKPCVTLYASSRNYESVYPGETYVLSFYVRGKGKATLGVLEYGRKKEEGQEPKMSYLGRPDIGKPVELTGEWQQVKGEYAPANEDICHVAPAVRLEGEGAWAIVDDCSFEEKPSDVSIKANLKSPVVSPGEYVEYEVAVTGDAAKKPDAKLNVSIYGPDDFLMKTMSSPIGDGVVQKKLKIAPDAPEGIYLFRFSVAGSGGGESKAWEVMPKDLKEQVVSLAGKVKFSKPERLMFVGDSLTDLFRGRNYVDKIELYLRCGNPGQFEVLNAGVGGDMIDRVAKRLEKDVIEPKPTHVFIFLGHNDSKVASPDYKKHACETDVFESTYRDVIRQIKEKTGARVTIMSATSSVWEICWETAQKRAAAGKSHNLFGKPSELELYNDMAKKVGKEFGCDTIDLYTPLKDIPDKRSYFTPDGVHISEKGNRLVAIEVLRYLAGQSH